MNSRERKEQRYKRRKEKRELKNIEISNKYSNIEDCFCFSKVMYYSDKCCNGVRYKKSTQNFILHQFTIVANTCYNIKNNKYKVGKTYNFKINERGKIRNIEAPHIKDRLVHKVITNEILNPIYERHLIYDNGANIKNKGFIFTLNRVNKKLYNYYLKNGLNGYILFIDYSNFFGNCSHSVIHEIHKKYIKNKYTIKVIEDYLFVVDGLGLGIEISQKEANMVPNILDHMMQNECGKTIRYMDDSIYFVFEYEKAKEFLDLYNEKAINYGIIVNMKKSFIYNIDRFIFCKWIYKINENGKIIRLPIKKTIKRQKEKLKKLKKLNIDINEIKITKTCFNAYLSISNISHLKNK